jgi:hypothetical protein
MKRISAILVFGFVVLAFCSCQPLVFASSDSPDPKYSCEVYEGSPSLLWGRNFRYYFRIKNNYAPDPQGEDFEYDSEKELRVEDIKFEWSGKNLKVTINTGLPAAVVAVADFSDNEQHWTRK